VASTAVAVVPDVRQSLDLRALQVVAVVRLPVPVAAVRITAAATFSASQATTAGPKTAASPATTAGPATTVGRTGPAVAAAGPTVPTTEPADRATARRTASTATGSTDGPLPSQPRYPAPPTTDPAVTTVAAGGTGQDSAPDAGPATPGRHDPPAPGGVVRPSDRRLSPMRAGRPQVHPD